MTANQPFDFLLQWHLTERCNLRCRHCYQSGAKGDELSLAEIAEAAAEAGEMLRDWEQRYRIALARSCNVTGGEPLLRSDLFEILELIGDQGFDLYLLTNGTLIDGGSARRLAAARVQGVQVSLEGPPAVHEAIRGPGSFAAAAAGVGHLLAAGLPVTLNLTLSRLNAPHLEAMVALARDLGVPRLGLARLVPCGRGGELAAEMLAPGELAAIYRDLFSRRVPGLAIVSGDPLAAQLGLDPPAPLDTAIGGCAAGVSGLTLLPDGTILPCRRLEVPLGNVRRDALREVWAGSPILADLRDRSRYRGRCRECARWAVCRGCRAVAWAAAALDGSPDHLAEDPQCFFREP